jgi:hypothetical protein
MGAGHLLRISPPRGARPGLDRGGGSRSASSRPRTKPGLMSTRSGPGGVVCPHHLGDTRCDQPGPTGSPHRRTRVGLVGLSPPTTTPSPTQPLQTLRLPTQLTAVAVRGRRVLPSGSAGGFAFGSAGGPRRAGSGEVRPGRARSGRVGPGLLSPPVGVVGSARPAGPAVGLGRRAVLGRVRLGRAGPDLPFTGRGGRWLGQQAGSLGSASRPGWVGPGRGVSGSASGPAVVLSRFALGRQAAPFGPALTRPPWAHPWSRVRQASLWAGPVEAGSGQPLPRRPAGRTCRTRPSDRSRRPEPPAALPAGPRTPPMGGAVG